MGAHGHPEGPTLPMNRIAWAVLVPLAVATLVGLVLLWPSATPPTAQPPAPEFKGVVLALQGEECTGEQTGPPSSCGTVTARITTPEGDREIEAPLSRSPSAPDLSVGDEVVVAASESPDGPIYGVVDHQRGSELVVVLVALALALVAFGRWRGFTALVGLAITFGVLFAFIVPAVIAGSSPVLVALVGASLITLTVLYLTHGVSLPTTVAVLGTMTALASRRACPS
ncbi:YibE/F family protein [Phycicoccus sp. MQZ13P-5]|uniref:YibE/F family protein n=1 Tax=Phycicoccus sonneratiae TaxID=2807628 RepID=A0ABS2CM84_9MICO|nr:YibE/F family protein [Phycicoccus sonneraticus]